MKMTQEELKKNLYSGGKKLIILAVAALLIGKIRTPNTTDKKSSTQESMFHIAPIYNLYMNVADQSAQVIEASTEYTRVRLTENQADFFATEELRSGTWSASLVLNLKTLRASMCEEYPGKGVGPKLALVQFTPNPYGGFDLEFTYADGRPSAHGKFVPVWNKPKQEGLTIKGLVDDILDAVGNTRVN
jgi:hypothetical protein